MEQQSLTLWQRTDGIDFYKWPYLPIGFSARPELAMRDICALCESTIRDKESATNMLTTLIEKSTSCGVVLNLHIYDVETAAEGRPEPNLLKNAILSMEREGQICFGRIARTIYHREKLHVLLRP